MHSNKERERQTDKKKHRERYRTDGEMDKGRGNVNKMPLADTHHETWQT
jgi:hypothetical protein